MNAGTAPTGRDLFTSRPLTFQSRRAELPILVPVCPQCGHTELKEANYDLLPLRRLSLTCSAATLTLRCEQCSEASYALAFYCSTIPDPAGAGHCRPELIDYLPDARRQFTAEADSAETWTITRRIYKTGRRREGPAAMPYGPFVIDQHLFPAVRRLSAPAGIMTLLDRLTGAAQAFLADDADTPRNVGDIPG